MAKRNIVIDTPPAAGVPSEQQREAPTTSSLVSWVMVRVADWEDHRETNFDAIWDEYYRLWRGIWNPEDKSRMSERSKIINPALSQAVESTTAELEEATFGSGRWFDVSDNFNDPDKTDIQMWRDQMAEDMTKEDVESAISEIFLNGAIYGTGIGKITLNEVTNRRVVATNIGDTEITTAGIEEDHTIRVGLQAIHPKEFVIDPTARTVDQALGMAHITTVPKHDIMEKQTQGIYREVPISGYTDTVVQGERDENKDSLLSDVREEDKTLLIEYHGFVPKNLLEAVDSEDLKNAGNATELEDIDNEEILVEAIVTIANSGTLLRAVENPYIMGDRCFVAYQHDTVPNRFWGRGICEKGYNPQKALDAEQRGRIDAMALTIHPMMAMDATRVQRGTNFEIGPGKNVFTNGDPKDILMPFNFGQVNNNTFSQSADLERQVQMGTGAMDSATPVADNARNATSSGMSMIQGGAIKRSKRTLANIQRRMIRPFINKAAWRYMQFAPDRYPATDLEFDAYSVLGIVARELEQNQLANMLKTVPSESPAFWMLLKGIFENSDISNREEMMVIIDQMMQQSLQKQANPEPDPIVALKQKEIELDAQIEQAKLAQKADDSNKDLQIEIAKLQLEREKLAMKWKEVILDAKIEAAQMEQDSLVTAVQNATAKEDSIRKAAVQLNKNSGAKA